MSSNPFYVGGPVPIRYFIGRSLEIKIAFDQISKRAHAAFYGSPGIGKSSLLQALTAPESWELVGVNITDFYIVYLNCTDISPFTPSKFFREILELLKDQIESQADIEEAIDIALQEEILEKGDLRRILGKIGRQGKCLLLLLDDFDWTLYTSEQYTEAEMLTFLNEFRNLAVHSSESRYLSTVVTSFRSITELGPGLSPAGSPWYNHYLCLLIPPFSQKEVDQNFFSVDSSLFIPLVPKLQSAVFQMTGGHPSLLKNALHILYGILQTGEQTDTEIFARDFITRTQHFFRDIWKLSTDEEQVLLMFIALHNLEGKLNRRDQYSLRDLDLVFSQRRRELFDLEGRGIIRRVENSVSNEYEFTSTVMQWWVIQEIENSNEAQLEQREKVFFNWMSREQANRVKTGVRQIWQQKEAIKGTIEWFAEIIGEFIPS